VAYSVWRCVLPDERFVYPMVEKFMCQLYAPTSWEVIPNTKYVHRLWELTYKQNTCNNVKMFRQMWESMLW